MFTVLSNTRHANLYILTALAIMIVLLRVNTYVEQRRNEATAIDQQPALVNAARETCLDEGHNVLKIPPGANPNTYYPLPPGKQTALVNAAIQACVDEQVSEWAGK
ncbi:MAG TPA: hypothetical protein VJM08_12275 [Anaerolineales bacterium]|nr:hypothetical protein [Anaerolineales bacterium]